MQYSELFFQTRPPAEQNFVKIKNSDNHGQKYLRIFGKIHDFQHISLRLSVDFSITKIKNGIISIGLVRLATRLLRAPRVVWFLARPKILSS